MDTTGHAEFLIFGKFPIIDIRRATMGTAERIVIAEGFSVGLIRPGVYIDCW